MSTKYANYSELAEQEVEGQDYRIVLRRRPQSRLVIIAPHGGSIEPRTSDIAIAVAGAEFSLYLFEGIKPSDNYESLHLPSTTFNEPRLEELLRESEIALSIHGCDDNSTDIHVGGLDDALAGQIAEALRGNALKVVYPSEDFPGRNPANICNRGKTERGVQLEFTAVARKKSAPDVVATPIRDVLIRWSRGQ